MTGSVGDGVAEKMAASPDSDRSVLGKGPNKVVLETPCNAIGIFDTGRVRFARLWCWMLIMS